MHSAAGAPSVQQMQRQIRDLRSDGAYLKLEAASATTNDEQEEQRAATNALGSVDVERNVDEEFEHDCSEHAHHGVGEFLLHWVRGRESAVSVDAKVSIDVTTRDRFAEFRRDVRVVFVVVLFEFFRPRWGVRFSSREQHVERHATDEADVDDGDGYREGV